MEGPDVAPAGLGGDCAVLFKVLSMEVLVFGVHFAVCDAQCTVYSVHLLLLCASGIVQCAVFSLQCQA